MNAKFVLPILGVAMLPAACALGSYQYNFAGQYLLEAGNTHNWVVETHGNIGFTWTPLPGVGGGLQLTLTGSTGPVGSPTPYVDFYTYVPARSDNTSPNVSFHWEFDSDNLGAGPAGDKVLFIGDWLPQSGSGSKFASAGYRYLWGDDEMDPGVSDVNFALPDAGMHKIGWRLFSDNDGIPDVFVVSDFVAPNGPVGVVPEPAVVLTNAMVLLGAAAGVVVYRRRKAAKA